MESYFSWIKKIAAEKHLNEIYLEWMKVAWAFREAFKEYPNIVAAVWERPTLRERLYAAQLQWRANMGFIPFAMNGVDYLTLARRSWAMVVILENRNTIIEGAARICRREALDPARAEVPADLMDAVIRAIYEMGNH